MHYLRVRVRVRIIWKSISAAKNTQMTRCTSSALARRWKRRRAEGWPFASRWIYSMAADYLRIRWRRSRINFCLDWTCVSTPSKATYARLGSAFRRSQRTPLTLATVIRRVLISHAKCDELVDELVKTTWHHIQTRDAYFILFCMLARSPYIYAYNMIWFLISIAIG